MLETRVRNFAKVDKTEEITKEIAEVEAIIVGIKERVTDFKDMAQGVFRECAECAKTNQFLLTCLNHMLTNLGEEEMEEAKWEAMAVTGKMQVFLSGA